MIKKNEIKSLLDQAIAGTDIFVVELKVSSANKIIIHIDTLEGITIDECVRISRFIEHQLDKDNEDFEIEVSSPGLTAAFKTVDQYRKNTGKKIECLTRDGKKQVCQLISVEENGINVEITKLVKQEGKKKKTEVTESDFIEFDKINIAKVVIEF